MNTAAPEQEPISLGRARRERDAKENYLLFCCSDYDPDTHESPALVRMVHWSDGGEGAFQKLREEFFQNGKDFYLVALQEFRDACLLVHNIELAAVTAGHAIAI